MNDCKNCKNSTIIFFMGFWDNVKIELDYLGMTNKVLAERVGIAASNIGKGIKMGSSPSAETAVKIANVLNFALQKNSKTRNKNYFFQLIRLVKTCSLRSLKVLTQSFQPQLINYLRLIILLS